MQHYRAVDVLVTLQEIGIAASDIFDFDAKGSNRQLLRGMPSFAR